MSSVFPTTLDSFLTNVDDVDIVTAADMNNVQDAIAAAQATMGTGSPASANSVANSLMRRNVDGIPYFTSLYSSIGSSVGTPVGSTLASWTPMVYDTIHSQVGTAWMVQYPSVFWCLTSGLLTIEACVSFPFNATGHRGIAIDIDIGTFLAAKVEPALAYNTPAGVGTHHMYIQKTWPVRAGQVLRVLAMQDSGGTLTTAVQGALTPEVVVYYH
jgi:hypothetical protein